MVGHIGDVIDKCLAVYLIIKVGFTNDMSKIWEIFENTLSKGKIIGKNNRNDSLRC